jgi:hypothetical protein
VCFSWIRILCFESGIFEGLQKVEKWTKIWCNL